VRRKQILFWLQVHWLELPCWHCLRFAAIESYRLEENPAIADFNENVESWRRDRTFP
jgi:hypothetical protein